MIFVHLHCCKGEDENTDATLSIKYEAGAKRRAAPQLLGQLSVVGSNTIPRFSNCDRILVEKMTCDTSLNSMPRSN